MLFKKDRPPGSVEPEDVSEMVSHSRVAGIISATLSQENKKYILDFGKLTQGAVDFFGNFSCKYDVVNLFSELQEAEILPWESKDQLEEIGLEEKFVNFEKKIKKTIKNYGVKKYDAIFLWDQFNFLESWQIKRVFNIIKPLCHWKTNILLVFPKQKDIPAKPLICSIVDYDCIRYKIATDARIKNPEHDKLGFYSLAEGFEQTHSSLSKHGIKECLFSIKRQK